MLAGVQGRDKRGSRSWVTHYHISYSEDAYRWEWARDIYGDKKVSAAYGHIYGRIYGDGITRAWSLCGPGAVRDMMMFWSNTAAADTHWTGWK